MFSAFTLPEVRGSDTSVFQAVLAAASYSLLLAMGGFFIGVVVGLILAIVMQRFLFFRAWAPAICHCLTNRAADRACTPDRRYWKPN